MNKLGLACVVACATGALSAPWALPAQAATTVNVTCSSLGQQCDNFANFPGRIAPGTRIILTTPQAHCSKVKYIAIFMRPFYPPYIGDAPFWVTVTKPLAPNETATFKFNDPRPADALRIYAEGIPGGCNTGRLQAWGVTLSTVP